ncbi:thioesterase [Pseudomonas alcaligenes]|uniref:Thioesterase n=1 Tax=Aquipseudomonas alcaligenes TaxID=43263 RepID=A0ABR7S172_AQUAC|nr:thioesterase family protein [Pseudomonas alcaligenes]MBC9250545.1 thioesterase [Pseudomonas alcaligenes]
MNLWFRLIWMLLTLPWRKPVQPLASSVLRMTVLPNDLDFNGHINNGRYLTLADVARMDFVLRSGAAKVAWQHKALPIVGDAMAKFRRDLKPFQRFEVHSRILGWEGKWTFLEHRFVRHGRVHGLVLIRGLFKAAGGTLDPQEFARSLGQSPVSPALPEWLLDWHRSCESASQALRVEEDEGLPNAG